MTKLNCKPFLVLICAQLACPLFARQTVVGHVPRIAARLSPAGALDASSQLDLSIALPWRKRTELTNLLTRLYDPASPDYRHFLTSAQFLEEFGPTAADCDTVAAFVRASGFSVIEERPSHALLRVRGSVSAIESAFHLKLLTYQDPREHRLFFAPDAEPTLELDTPICHISGLDNYRLPKPMSLRFNPVPNPSGIPQGSGSAPGGAYIGNDFRAAYVPGVTLEGSGQSIALVEFDGFYSSDIKAYQALASLPSVPIKTVLLDGFNGAPGENNIEVALDIDMANSMDPGAASIIAYEGTYADDILDRIATDNAAKQISASWTYNTDPATDQYFLQFAAQGQSFFNASGDGDADVGQPAPPTDDPNITVVGGTTLSTSRGAWASETVWNWDIEYGSTYDGVGSSGGSSVANPIPAWQQGLATIANGGSPVTRNLPDVAMVADNVYLIANEGESGWVGGTSCATPLWAGFMALVNQQAASVGKPSIGFADPPLYALARSAGYSNYFHDITNGNNTWSQSPLNYYAVPGYDLCTGWGSPTGSNLINALAPPDALTILPPGSIAAAGGVGGPFGGLPSNFLLTNSSGGSISWSVGSTVSWLTLTPSNGMLTPGEPGAAVQIALNGAAAGLPLGFYSATIFFTNLGDQSVQSRSIELSIIIGPSINPQPLNTNLLGGQTALFTAGIAGGLPLFWQWQHNGVNLTNSNRVVGSQGEQLQSGQLYGSFSSALSISNVNFTDDGTYTLVVSNAAGSVTSGGALLAVAPSGPIIVSEPSSLTNQIGSTAQFSVAALGTQPLGFQWQQNGTNLADGGNISGSGTAVLTITGVSGLDDGTYTAILTNALGSVTSSPATLTVLTPWLQTQEIQNGGFETGNFSGWSQGGNFNNCVVATGYPATHSGKYGALLGPAGSLGYLSQVITAPPGQPSLLSFWINSDGATPNEFVVSWNGNLIVDFTNVPAQGWTNLQFFITPSTDQSVIAFGFRDDNGFFGFDDVSLEPLVGVTGTPVFTTEPASMTLITNGGAATLTASVLGAAPLSYQWQFNGAPIANATNPVLSLVGLSTNQSGTYILVVSNSMGFAQSIPSVLQVATGLGELITFDNLGSFGTVPNGYAGLEWSNVDYLPAWLQPDSGYGAGLISTPNVAYNSYGTAALISNSQPFDLVSAWCTAAWNNSLQLEAIGYSNSSVIYDNSYSLSATRPTLINFNYTGITAVELISSGGVLDTSYAGDGTEFVMDNLTVIYPPTPPFIAVPPVSQTGAPGDVVSFEVSASGSTPLAFLWETNSQPVAGATDSIFTITNLPLSDNGAEISCSVSNSIGVVATSPVLLTVIGGDAVFNGGFESGDFSGWTAGGNFQSTFVTDGAPWVHTGLYGAQLGAPFPPATLTQNLRTLSGQSYRVSCWVYCDGQNPNQFTINWNGAAIFSQTNIPDVGWTNFVATAVASSPNCVLQFSFFDDPWYLGLDDITVTPLPTLLPGISAADGGVQLTWQSSAGISFQVQYATNLAQPVWLNLGPPSLGINASTIITDAPATNTARFYRLVVTP